MLRLVSRRTPEVVQGSSASVSDVDLQAGTSESQDAPAAARAPGKGWGKGARRRSVVRRASMVHKMAVMRKARKGFRAVKTAFAATHQVALSNKIGEPPTGEDLKMAQALHSGIKEALREDKSVAANAMSVGQVTALHNKGFRKLREAFAIDEVSFRASVELAAGRLVTDMKMISTGMASGKSKAFFFLSPDQHYFFKSANSEDVKSLLGMLPDYAAHVKANRTTMLPRYVALFRVRVSAEDASKLGSAEDLNLNDKSERSEGTSAPRPSMPTMTAGGGASVSSAKGQKGKAAKSYTVDFVCMTYAFGGVKTIDRRFDLKGSTCVPTPASNLTHRRTRRAPLAEPLAAPRVRRHSRNASEKEKMKKTPTLKDGDWVSEGYKFPPTTESENMLEALEQDTKFLARKGLIDYSLLVGIHVDHMQAGRPNEERGTGVQRHIRMERTPGLFVVDHHEPGGIFTRMYIALIDILTPYGMRKVAETFFMGTLRCGADISCQPPHRYAKRFMRFMRSHRAKPAAPAGAPPASLGDADGKPASDADKPASDAPAS